MKISVEQLPKHFELSVSPIYFVSGEETLLVEEAAQHIRQALHQKDFLSREVFQVGKGFDWEQFYQALYHMDLFAERKLIELRLGDHKISEAGKKNLLAYAENPPDDKVLLIISDKLERSTQSATWFKVIEKQGIWVPIWSVALPQLPMWIKKRCQAYHLQLSDDAIGFLVEQTEGNLLAASQAIEKLHLLNHQGVLMLETVMSAISDNSHYDIFTFIDSMLGANTARALRILHRLKGEGIEPVLILWAIARELRTLLSMAETLQHQSLDATLQKHSVWEKRKPLVRTALKRNSIKKLQKLLYQASILDRMIKGVEVGDVWNGFSQIVLKLSS